MKGTKDKLIAYSQIEPVTGCWLWTRATVWDGYGRLRCGGKTYRAHRVSYQVFVGEIPEGLHILHNCHRPGCINPDHLRAGTQQDNSTDMVKAGRSTFGERHHKAKLTREDVRMMRKMYAEGGVTHRELAKRYGVTRSVVSHMIRGLTWNNPRALQETSRQPGP